MGSVPRSLRVAGTRDVPWVSRVPQRVTDRNMTKPDRDSSESTVRPTGDVPDGGYEWTCPFCGKSRLNSSAGGSGRQNAIAALRTHVLASDGDGHGPRNEPPGELDSLTLSEHVVRVEGRR